MSLPVFFIEVLNKYKIQTKLRPPINTIEGRSGVYNMQINVTKTKFVK